MSKLYSDPEQRPPVFKTPIQEYLSIFLCIFGPAAASMASSAYQTLLRATSVQFNVQGGQLSWSVSSVMLANGACLLLMGGIADAFGRKNAMIIGFTMYAVFSLIAGFMNNFVLLCLFRGLQGASVACATPASAGFLGSTYKDSRRKNMVMSCFSIGAPVGGASGFFLAGICEVALNWRSTQYFLSILFAVLAISVFFILPNDKKINWQHSKQVFRKMDYLGALLSLASFTLICFSLTDVDNAEKRWRTPYIIALLIVGVALIPVFVLYELYIPKEPLMPMQLFRSRNFCLCMCIAGLCWMVFFGFLNYNAMLYFENIKGYSPIIVACCFLTQPISGILVNLFAGFTMHLIPGRIFMALGHWVVGADLIYNISNRVTLSSLEKHLQSRGAGTFNTLLQLGSAIALGFNSTIISSKYAAYGTPQQNDDPQGLLDGIKYCWYVGISFAGAAFTISLFLKVGVIGKSENKEELVEDEQ
ncbi:hypothetical protein JL09_g655 [Pichia kudriavzevii]|uniref:Major facilitator superfamily (MFS) profile domain-containing protein n=1 Tax=Pichia kudriavzevii TaxID=4909 RepID=A0A099P7T8_PICKU|nr:hypothetical protein JL09_g655 [Pichia kudriavzevii]